MNRMMDSVALRSLIASRCRTPDAKKTEEGLPVYARRRSRVILVVVVGRRGVARSRLHLALC
jgi:hypothetical protein